MATTCCEPKRLAFGFTDEAGDTTRPYFVASAFFTFEPDRWRALIDREISYSADLHFQRISRNPADPRYLATERLVALLNRRTDWWAHYLLIDRSLVDTSYFSNKDQIEFNHWMGTLIRYRTRQSDRCYRVTIADRSRNDADGYLPGKLQERLDMRQIATGGPHVVLETRPARDDRLVQVADTIASAVHQIVLPSENPNKQAIATKINRMVRPMRGARANQRIYAWPWKPPSEVA